MTEPFHQLRQPKLLLYGLQTKKSDVQLSSVQVINNNTCASLLNNTYVVDASQACVIPTISYALSCKVNSNAYSRNVKTVIIIGYFETLCYSSWVVTQKLSFYVRRSTGSSSQQVCTLAKQQQRPKLRFLIFTESVYAWSRTLCLKPQEHRTERGFGTIISPPGHVSCTSNELSHTDQS